MNIIERFNYKFNRKRFIEKSEFFDAEWYEKKYGINKKDAAQHYLTEGYKNDYNPSPKFSTFEYYYANPDVVNFNPLLHYEIHGKYENRKIFSTKLPRQGINSPKTIELISVFKSSRELQNKKKCAIFATYSSDGTIPEYVVYYLKELKKNVDFIILVGDYYLKDSKELDKVTDYVHYAIYKRHNCYDFGSYKIGIEFLRDNGLLSEIQELYIANDSCYGPVNDFSDLFVKMKGEKCDFWGLIEGNDSKPHIQSFFYCFKNNVINDPMFINFFDRVKPNLPFMVIVERLEVEFTEYLSRKYTYKTAYNAIYDTSYSLYAGCSNSTVFPLSLLKQGFPLVKVKALDGRFDSNLRENKMDTFDYIRQNNVELYEIIKSDLIRRGTFQKDESTIRYYEEFLDKEYISFDIFDTLLVRPFVTPTDLFKYIEVKEDLKGFYKERIKAEKIARKSNHYKEITLEEIYDKIPPKFKNVKSIELQVELSLCKRNPTIEQLYDFLVSNNKKIVAISDMYLPKEFIIELLKKNGFNEISEVYVSSEYKVTKGEGELFELVLNDLGIKANEMAHIGDNQISDIYVPNQLGISTCYIEKIFDQFISAPANEKYKELWEKQKDSLQLSMHIGLLSYKFARREENVRFWKEFAYSFAGPWAISYLNFIVEEAKSNKIDKLLFVARDGWILSKLYSEFYANEANISSDYVYLNRATVIGALNFEELNDYYCKEQLKLAKNSVPGLHVHNEYDANKEEYKSFKGEVDNWVNKNRLNLCNYLNIKCDGYESVAIVDMVSGHYTSLKGAVLCLKNKIKLGFFFSDFNLEVSETPYEVYCEKNEISNGGHDKAIELSEIFFTSPESSVSGLDKDGNPKFDNKVEKNKLNRCNDIYEGVKEYYLDFKAIFGLDKELLFDGNLCIQLNDSLANHISPDIRTHLSQIVYARTVIE